MRGLPLSSEDAKTARKAVLSAGPWPRLKILSQGQILSQQTHTLNVQHV